MSVYIIVRGAYTFVSNALNEPVVYLSLATAKEALAEFIAEFGDAINSEDYSIKVCHIADN